MEENAPLKEAHIVEGIELEDFSDPIIERKSKLDQIGPILPKNALFFDLTTGNKDLLDTYISQQEKFIEKEDAKINKKAFKLGKIMSIIEEQEDSVLASPDANHEIQKQIEVNIESTSS